MISTLRANFHLPAAATTLAGDGMASARRQAFIPAVDTLPNLPDHLWTIIAVAKGEVKCSAITCGEFI